MWFEESIFYQIYPLGFCGAEFENDFGETRSRLHFIRDEIPRLKELGITAVLFNPLFESETHGYNTIDFFKIDRRLGTNEEFIELVQAFHDAGIKVVLDGVFNHVGRAFAPFQEVLAKREATDYRFWFNINFYSDNRYHDGLSYENWEGHDELVKLRLDDWNLQNYLMNAVRYWIDVFKIDGLRLDVCYLLPPWFLELLRRTVREKREDFFLVGEVIHIQNFADKISPDRLDSITNYECFKGMISSINSDNLYEIEYSLNRLFGPFNWCLYTGKKLLSFVDNHDVLRAYTAVQNQEKIFNLYQLLFTMPGIPCLYYGSEYGAEGDKSNVDRNLRPFIGDIDRGKVPALTEYLKKLCKIRKEHNTFAYGSYEKLFITNKQLAFARTAEERLVSCFNIEDRDYTFHLNGRGINLYTGEEVDLSSFTLPPYGYAIFKVL